MNLPIGAYVLTSPGHTALNICTHVIHDDPARSIILRLVWFSNGEKCFEIERKFEGVTRYWFHEKSKWYIMAREHRDRVWPKVLEIYRNYMPPESKITRDAKEFQRKIQWVMAV